MSSLAQALGYLSEVTKFASQGPVSYGLGECVCMVRPYTVIAGVLAKSDTDKLVDDYVNVRGGSLDRFGRVPVVVSLRTLVYDDPRRPAKGLLLLPAMLDVNGRLSADFGTQQPWIPLERLTAEGSAPRTVTVASLADYRHFQIEHQAEFDDPVTWGVYVDLALSMFDSIAHVDEGGLADSACRVDGELCRIKCVSLKEPTLTASNVFSHLAVHASEGLPATLQPYFGESELTDEDDAPTLTMSRVDLDQAEQEREALASKAADTPNSIQTGEKDAAGQPASGARLTPDGSAGDAGKPALPAAHDDEALGTPTDPTSLRATDRLVQSAKAQRGSCSATARLSQEGYDALRLLCSNDRDPVSCVQLPMGEEALELAAAFTAARVTECAVLGEDEPYILFAVSSGVFRRRANQALEQAFGQASGGLEGSWLRRGAPARDRARVTQAFLQRAEEFLGRAPATPEAAARALGERLRSIDQLRCELVEGFAEIRTASDLARQQEERLLALARLRDEHTKARARLGFWSDLAEQGRAHRALGRGKKGAQLEAIRSAAQEGEDLALNCGTLDEVVEAYRGLVKQQEDKLLSTRRETARLELRVRKHSLSGTKGAEDVALLVDLCRLGRAGKRELDSLFAGGELSVARLDRVLDRTVRPCEFWLAVHLFEARELQRGAIRPVARWRTVATIYEIPGLVGRLTSKAPIDTLLCLRSERMRTPQALSCLALARRAVVMGDPSGIGPRWELDPQADRDLAHLSMGTDGWDFVTRHGLGASSPQRFFSATKQACEQVPRTLYRLHGLSPSAGPLAQYRAEAFYEGVGPRDLAPGSTSLYLMDKGPHAPERVGDSLRNRSEAERLVAWVISNAERIRGRYAGRPEEPEGRLVCAVTPYTSQAQLIRDLLNTRDPVVSRMVDVRTVRQASGAAVPAVVFSGVTSVAELDRDFTFGTSSLLSVCAAMASKCLAVFCDDTWRNEGAGQSPAVRALVGQASSWVEPTEPRLPVGPDGPRTAEGSEGHPQAGATAQGSDDKDARAADGNAMAGEESGGEGPVSEGADPQKGSEGADSGPGADAPTSTGGSSDAEAPEKDTPSGAAAARTDGGGSAGDEDGRGEPGSAAPAAHSPQDGQDDAASGKAADNAREAPTAEVPEAPAGTGAEGVDSESSSDRPEAGTPEAPAEPAPDSGQAAAASGAPEPDDKPAKVYATLSQILHELVVDGQLATEPDDESVFRWLQRDGYVRVSSARDGSIGWVPTQRGVRCGIYPQQKEGGALWCGFSDGAAEYVLASVQLHSKNR